MAMEIKMYVKQHIIHAFERVEKMSNYEDGKVNKILLDGKPEDLEIIEKFINANRDKVRT